MGTPWFVDLVRSHVPLGGDGSVSAAGAELEAMSARHVYKHTILFPRLREVAAAITLSVPRSSLPPETHGRA